MPPPFTLPPPSFPTAFLFSRNREAGEIQLHKRVAEGAGKETYEQFVAELPPKEGMYAIYDFDYETDEGGKRNKLMFIVWAPDDAPIKEKMLYASSKDGLKKKIVGIQWEVQGTDYEEVEFAEIVNKFAK